MNAPSRVQSATAVPIGFGPCLSPRGLRGEPQIVDAFRSRAQIAVVLDRKPDVNAIDGNALVRAVRRQSSALPRS